jgi:hypothetical protein
MGIIGRHIPIIYPDRNNTVFRSDVVCYARRVGRSWGCQAEYEGLDRKASGKEIKIVNDQDQMRREVSSFICTDIFCSMQFLGALVLHTSP